MSRAKDYLVNIRNIAAERVTIVNGGYKELYTMEFWLMQRGAGLPAPYPTGEPKNVRFKKGSARKHIDALCKE
jgi:hypothetical protein